MGSERTSGAATRGTEACGIEANGAEADGAATRGTEACSAEADGAATRGTEACDVEANDAVTRGAEVDVVATRGAEADSAATRGAEADSAATRGAEACDTGADVVATRGAEARGTEARGVAVGGDAVNGVAANVGDAESGTADATSVAADSDSGVGVGGRRHVYLCPLRWADMDSLGHVNNVVYLRYLEQARVDWMFITAKEAGVEEFSLGTVVARHEIEYKRPLVYRADPVRVETWVTRIANSSFTVAYEVKDDDWIYATAATVLVPYDLGDSRPRRITAVERGYLEQFLAKDAAAVESGRPVSGSARTGRGARASA